jgi:hypothetical protein
VRVNNIVATVKTSHHIYIIEKSKLNETKRAPLSL